MLRRLLRVRVAPRVLVERALAAAATEVTGLALVLAYARRTSEWVDLARFARRSAARTRRELCRGLRLLVLDAGIDPRTHVSLFEMIAPRRSISRFAGVMPLRARSGITLHLWPTDEAQTAETCCAGR